MGLFATLGSMLGGALEAQAKKIDVAHLEVMNYSSNKLECLKYGCEKLRRINDKDMVKITGYVSACQNLAKDINISDKMLMELYDDLHSARNAYALKAIVGPMQNRGLITKDGEGYHRNW